MKKFWAFTLTEVLITLSIVGVISVLTLPNVMASYQKKIQVAALQRTYNMITNATASYMNDKRIDNLLNSDLTTIDGIESFMTNYFELVKICVPEDGDVSSAYACLAETYKSSDRASDFSPATIGQFPVVVCGIINSGASICISTEVDGGYFPLYIDTNAVEKPNTASRDFFGDLKLWPDGKLMGVRYVSEHIDDCPTFSGIGTPTTLFATPCFAKIQQEGWQMNY